MQLNTIPFILGMSNVTVIFLKTLICLLYLEIAEKRSLYQRLCCPIVLQAS